MPEIKELIEKLVREVTKNESVKKLWDDEPVQAIEKVLGVDLPDDIVEKVIAGVKAQMTADKLEDAAKLLKKLF